MRGRETGGGDDDHHQDAPGGTWARGRTGGDRKNAPPSVPVPVSPSLLSSIIAITAQPRSAARSAVKTKERAAEEWDGGGGGAGGECFFFFFLRARYDF